MAIRFDTEKKIWVLETLKTAYVFGVHHSGRIKHIYWGNIIKRFEDYPGLEGYYDSPWWEWNDELPGRGEGNKTEACLQVVYSDAVRDVNLRYANYSITGNMLNIVLTDEHYKLEVTLVYKVYEACDLMEKYVLINNRSDSDILIETIKSGAFYIPQKKDLKFTHLSGMWGHETQITRELIECGKKVIDSREGRTSHFHNPFFAIDDRATEDNGDVWFGLLAWGGNWKTAVRKIPYENIEICTGINEWDSAFMLKAGETFETPVIHYGYTDKGFGHMSRTLHKFQMEQIMPKANAQKIRKVLYNSWEATAFDVNEENQKKLADKAAKIGCEIFVMDDGWFGERNSDKAGLGDWQINPGKFPNGLESLIQYVNDKGMAFGLWIEPEMTNPDSNLYRTHPEWVLSFPNRPGTLSRNQLMLNLGREDVKQFVFDSIDNLLANYNIKFIKWDMNRPVYEAGWTGNADPRKMWIKAVENLYDIWRSLKEKYPDVIMEACSGGGARIDTAIMQYADQFWTSDNTDPFDRQYIQEGFSMCYNTKMMMCWVTDWGGKDAYPLEYRFHASMMGSLGIGANLTEYSEGELKEFAKYIQQYKAIRDTVQHGSLYRLFSPKKDAFTVNEYVSQDKTEIVLFCLKNPSPLSILKVLRVKFKALDEDAVYTIEGTNKNFSGSYLMNRGLDINFMQDWAVSVTSSMHFNSRVIVLKKK